MARKAYLIFTWQPQEAESTRCVCSDKSSWKWLVDQSFSSKDIDLEEGGQHSTIFSIFASGPNCPGFYSQQKKNSGEKIIDVAEVNQWRWVEESEQWVENVDQTHQVLADIYLAFLPLCAM